MCNIMWIYGIAIVAVLAATSRTANAMEFEQFMSSLARSDNSDDKVDEASKPNDKEIVQFMKRSGLLEESNSQNSRYNQELLAALHALQRQRSIPVYPTENAKPETLVTTQLRPAREINSQRLYSSYQKPVTKDSSSVQSQQATLAALQSLNQQRSYSPLSSDSSDLSSTRPRSSSSSQSIPDATNSLIYSTSQQASSSDNDKAAMKDDRQGHYAYDTYDSGYDGNIVHARNPGGYEAQSYGHQPSGYSSGLGLKLPIPQISIKFDPLGLLKLLLQGIPRPLFNLNGRVFLGLELGKGIGLGKGAGGNYGGGHSGGGKIITIG
ncbi:hypothetical protein AVEN_187332-1 [Araneus ventricosus]|uniref:Uncharacterized protein n=1 Tax=Araneus ventricosus TaxID=182803 RepID=A0A4Y2HYZ1_ARAVE|nr:hypothetical protein AVEN_187332-1 [Araneus ventricosus]